MTREELDSVISCEQDPAVAARVSEALSRVTHFVVEGRRHENGHESTLLVCDLINETDTRKQDLLDGLYTELHGGKRTNRVVVGDGKTDSHTRYWVGAVQVLGEVEGQRTIAAPVYVAEHYELTPSIYGEEEVLSHARAYWTSPNSEAEGLEPNPSSLSLNTSDSSLFSRACEYLLSKALQHPIA